MPMNPRLLRPLTTGLVAVDADARAYINAVRIADGGQYMESGVQRAIDAFITGCKSDGIWDAIKASCILAGARTLAGALVPLKGAAPTNNGPFVSGDYNRETGLLGDGVGKYLDSNRNANADPQDNAHMAVWAAIVDISGDKALIGAGGNATGTSQLIATADSPPSVNRVGFRNQCSTQAIVPGAAAAGLIGASRSGSASYTARGASTNTTISQASQTPFNGNCLVFARNSATNTAGLFGAHRLAFYSIGESITLSDLDARLSTLMTAIGAAI